MEPILDRNILAEGSEECGRIARKLRRVSEAFDGRWAPGELPKGVSAKVEELTAGRNSMKWKSRRREVPQWLEPSLLNGALA